MQFSVPRNLKHTYNQLLEHFNNGWLLVGHNGKSIIDSENFLFKIASQPRAVIRVGIKKDKNKGHQSIGNLH
jgi:hypothetical protein